MACLNQTENNVIGSQQASRLTSQHIKINAREASKYSVSLRINLFGWSWMSFFLPSLRFPCFHLSASGPLIRCRYSSEAPVSGSMTALMYCWRCASLFASMWFATGWAFWYRVLKRVACRCGPGRRRRLVSPGVWRVCADGFVISLLWYAGCC